jgi:hypothetical protein
MRRSSSRDSVSRRICSFARSAIRSNRRQVRRRYSLKLPSVASALASRSRHGATRTPSLSGRAKNMVRRGTMSLPSGWGCMRNPKKLHQTSSKNQTSSKSRTRPLAARRPLPSRSRKRPHKTLRKRAAAQRAAAPRISQEPQEHGLAQPAVLSRPSEVVRQISDLVTVPLQVDHRESVGNRTGTADQRRPFPPFSVFTSGVSAITSVNAISMEWFNLMLRCTERYLDAIQIIIRGRTPGELIIAQTNLLNGNLNDAFEGANRVLRQTRR